MSILDPDAQVTTAGASDDRTVRLDELQNRDQEGPGLSAIHTGITFQVDDFGQDSRYSTFSPAAKAMGVQLPVGAADFLG